MTFKWSDAFADWNEACEALGGPYKITELNKLELTLKFLIIYDYLHTGDHEKGVLIGNIYQKPLKGLL